MGRHMGLPKASAGRQHAHIYALPWLVNPAAVQKMAITSPFGLFEFKRMPYGLRNAGTSQRHIRPGNLGTVRQLLPGWMTVVICSRSHEEHEVHVQQVLQALQDSGLVINGEKCMR